MKKIIVIIIMMTTLYVFAADQEKEPSGFRGFKWGENISLNKDFILSENEKGTKIYKRKNDKLKIGDADLTQIGYALYKEKFYGIIIFSKGSDNFSILKEIFIQNYGSYYQENKYIDEYYWKFDSVFISLSYNQFNEKTEISILYTPVIQEQNQDKKEKAAAANKDL